MLVDLGGSEERLGIALKGSDDEFPALRGERYQQHA
jgi:hypothetical protein